LSWKNSGPDRKTVAKLKPNSLIFIVDYFDLKRACQATPKTAPLTTLEIAPLSYSGYSGFRKRGLA
jgi:hypothetical protein